MPLRSTSPGLATAPAPPATEAATWDRQRQLATNALLPLAMVTTVSLAPVIGSNPARSGAARVIVTVLIGLTGLAALAGHHRTTRLGITFIATIGAFALPWQVAWWPLPGLVGVAVYVAAGQVPAMRGGREVGWRRGRLGRMEVAAITGIGAIAATALLIYQWLAPSTFGFGATLLNQLPAWSPPLAGVAFVAGNAAVEELLFRGVIFAHLTGALGTWPALLLQAAGFGALNLHGYPQGLVGVALTAGYGLLLGLLRLRSRGLLACWLAHALADAVIFAFIAQAAAHRFY